MIYLCPNCEKDSLFIEDFVIEESPLGEALYYTTYICKNCGKKFVLFSCWLKDYQT